MSIDHTLAAGIVSRDAWDTVYPLVSDPRTVDPITSVIVAEINAYYTRDSNTQYVDLEVLGAILESRTPNEKHREEIRLRLSKVSDICQSVSTRNVLEIYRSQQEYTLSREIASRMASNDRAGVEALLERYMELQQIQVERPSEEPTLDELLDVSFSPKNLLPLYPRVLGKACNGGMYPEQHMVIFARPECGKSLMAIHIASGWARSGKKGIFFENEDKDDSTRWRFLTNLSGMDVDEIRANRQVARELLKNHGRENIRIQPITPGSPEEIAHYVKVERPDWFVVNQIRNLQPHGRMSTVERLEHNATSVRNIAKKYGCAAISITQAGDSANNKLILEQGDVDFSNTGIPASADILLGVGANEDYRVNNLRELSTPKNKLSGESEWHATVKIDKKRSMVLES
jgi:hypothetical protein